MTEPGARGRNRLAHETSPYLLQHAGNPVDWYPWGNEAFEKARAEGKPVLLSIGYSTCHWCHVMAHESFEDEAVAALMNERFVNIKVDREERPDVDSVYMTFTQAMTGQGGWPMTVFLTPDREPFYAGTYFPPDDAHGRPGFRRLLENIARAWSEDPARVAASASDATAKIRAALERQAVSTPPDPVTPALAEQAVDRFRGAFDEQWGGFGRAPKFPSPGNLEFLLMYHARAGEDRRGPNALEMALQTLRRMAAGGIYDHLGGGFSRYSVDAQWLVPHFEKMLYDNAQLVRVYLHAWQLTGEPRFERVVRETLAYLEREMLAPEGGLYSAQDADSEGIEGKFFVWTPDEVEAALGDDAALFNAVFNVTYGGNFEDPHHPEFGRRTVLSRPRPLATVARDFGMAEPELETKVEEMRARMFEVREQRVHPGRDDKVLTSWNGLALAALAEGGRILGDEHYLDLARRNAAFVRERLWSDDGRLLHSYKDGVAKIDGLLEDYVYYGLGLVDLYRATGDLAHLEWARALFEVARERFHDPQGGGFFEAPADGETLILRQKPLFDAATPSGNGAMALLGFWLGRYYGRREWEEITAEVLALVQPQLTVAVSGFGSIVQAVELTLAPRREIAVVGSPGARAPLERELAQRYLPAALLAPAAAANGLPVLEGRDVTDGAAAFVCEDMVCELPARTPEELAAQLAP
jgi:uncharacterized protein